MPQSADRKTIKFGPETIYAELGLEPPNYHDLRRILLGFPSAFSLSHTPYLKLPNHSEGYTLARYDGPGHFVWMGTNPLERNAQAQENPPGLFSLDRDKGRILVAPDQSIPVRDSYHGHANHFGTQFMLSEVLIGLEDEGIKLFQVSRSFHHVVAARRRGIIDDSMYFRMERQVAEVFGLNNEWRGHGFIIDGPTTAVDVIAGKRLETARVDFTLNEDAVREQLTKDW